MSLGVLRSCWAGLRVAQQSLTMSIARIATLPMIQPLYGVSFSSSTDAELPPTGPQQLPEVEFAPIDHEYDSIILFPGQGAQTVGMGNQLLKYPAAKELYDIANEMLCYNLLKLCLEGPQEKLNKTIFSQPAIFVTSLAAAFRLREENPRAIEQCTGTAGFSVGELAALVFAGSMKFEDGLHLVRARAEAMQRCCDAEPSGMLSVLFDDRSTRPGPLVEAARAYCLAKLHMLEPVVEVASYLFPACRVIAGHNQALEFIERYGAEFGVRWTTRLPVSGAFHTELMRPASKVLRHCLDRIQLKRPIVPVFSNVDADASMKITDIIRKIPRQVYRPVRWEQSVIKMLQRPPEIQLPRVYEVGPGNQLTTMVKLMNRKAGLRCYNVEV